MFKYGKKAGYMGIALLVLAVIPLVVAACVTVSYTHLTLPTN